MGHLVLVLGCLTFSCSWVVPFLGCLRRPGLIISPGHIIVMSSISPITLVTNSLPLSDWVILTGPSARLDFRGYAQLYLVKCSIAWRTHLYFTCHVEVNLYSSKKAELADGFPRFVFLRWSPGVTCSVGLDYVSVDPGIVLLNFIRRLVSICVTNSQITS